MQSQERRQRMNSCFLFSRFSLRRYPGGVLSAKRSLQTSSIMVADMLRKVVENEVSEEPLPE